MADLVTLAQAKAWLHIPLDQTGDDATLQMLVSGASDQFHLLTYRESLLSQSYVERRDGSGTGTIVLNNQPVTAVALVSVNGITYPPSGNSGLPGFVFDDLSIRLVSGGAQFPWSLGIPAAFAPGVQNVMVSYTAGFAAMQSPLEGVVIPFAAPYTVTVKQQAQFVGGLVVTDHATLLPLAQVLQAPAAGQFSVDALGNITFAAADAGRLASASYLLSGVPPAVQVCVLDMLAWVYKQRDRTGLVSERFADNLTTSYSQAPLSANAQLTISRYRNKVAQW